MYWQKQCTVSISLTIQYDRVKYVIEPSELTNGLLRKKVTIFEYPDGTIAIQHDGVSLPCSSFDKVGKVAQADVVSSKRLGAVLAFAKAQQDKIGLKRSQQSPGRRGQKKVYEEGLRRANPTVLLLSGGSSTSPEPTCLLINTKSMKTEIPEGVIPVFYFENETDTSITLDLECSPQEYELEKEIRYRYTFLLKTRISLKILASA